MTFQTAISTCLSRYADFTGRARRPECWWFLLFTALVVAAGGLLDQAFGLAQEATGGGPLAGLAFLVLLLPSLAVGARRLHDRGRSAWWLLMGLVPVAGPVILLFWFAETSQPGPNRFGPAAAEPVADGAGSTA